MSDIPTDFTTYFERATSDTPFPFQAEFAHSLPSIVNVPTGLGKTAMAVVGWLWRRFNAGEDKRKTTPRRLVYCLPMRTLVEQTRNNAIRWVNNLRKAELLQKEVRIHILMGGEDEGDWTLRPEDPAIIVGTQDMLLSRALNRGYAMGRAAWPMAFGLLNTDSLWVFDEIQLMGSGLATTAQLEAFRQRLGAKDGNQCKSVWMSATMQRNWLDTVDFSPAQAQLAVLELNERDKAISIVQDRIGASKPLSRAAAPMDKPAEVAKEIAETHAVGTLTLVVVNTVKRARELFNEIQKCYAPSSGGKRKKSPTAAARTPPKLVLLHSRFRPLDRKKRVDDVLAQPPTEGTICVSTQVVEAGVDISAKTLFTDVAPWSSLVQRFGRCNRRGEFNKSNDARVFWIDLPAKGDDAKKASLPYEIDELLRAREILSECTNGVGPSHLPTKPLPYQHTHVIRRKDVVELFDTTPDLAGNDIDIDRFVREVDETDVRVFWRAWEGDSPLDDEPGPTRDELCPAPVGEFKEFAKSKKSVGKIFHRDFQEGKWTKTDARSIYPGQVFLVHSDAGGYTCERGWAKDSETRVEPIPHDTPPPFADESYDDDGLSRTDQWQTIAKHTDAVCTELGNTIKDIQLDDLTAQCLRDAARWHDWGKAHRIFQKAIGDSKSDGCQRPPEWVGCRMVAKAPGKKKDKQGRVIDSGFWCRYSRKHFRHELASAIAVLLPNVSIAAADRDLVAYLIAAHHGKVRLSIRSMPNENKPRNEKGRLQPELRFARGVWDGDTLPETDLGGGITAPEVTLSLEPMELGLCELPPFAGQPSWLERTLGLRDKFGPFRLAYLESLLRAADCRASAAAVARAPLSVKEVAVG